MKIILLLSLFCFAFCFGQYDFKYYKADTLKLHSIETLEGKSFYQVSKAEDLLFYIKSSPKKYKLLFTFTNYCKPCVKIHPKILSLKENNQNIELLFLTDVYKGSEFSATEKYLKNVGNLYPIFSLADDDDFKNSKGKYEYYVFNPQKKKSVKGNRYTHFTQQLVRHHWDFGYGLVVVYDQENKPIYASTYNETEENVLKKVTSIISN